jgi:sugar phosphate isomerase/epimerase
MASIAAQLYSLRDLVSTDRERALRELGSIGYRAVEAYDPLADPAGFRTAADAAGLAVCAAHGPLLGPRRDELPVALRTLGTDRIIVPSVPAEGFAEAVDDTARRLDEAAAWAAGHGLRVGYHNHYWELAQTVDGRTAPHAQRVVELDHCATDMVTALAESYAYLSELEGAR